MRNIIRDKWLSCGIQEGDIILVHSNVKRTLLEWREQGVPLSPQDILRSFLDAIGPRGTLLLPLFNFDFASGATFDIRNTPSRMGALTEAGRNDPRSVRTGHPIYSFAALGHHASEFAGVDNQSGYSDESPFGILRRLGGKIAVLDLEDQHSMTYYHHVEEVKQVEYRYFKTFTSTYIDHAGNANKRSYMLYVRDIERGVRTDVNPAGELMWSAGLYSGYRPNVGPGLRVIDAQRMFDFVENLIDTNRALGTLYSIGEPQ